MSLILEALRKSEAQRRRGHAPDLHAEAPPLPALRRRALAGAWPLLAGMLVLLALWWTRAPRPAPVATVPASAAAGAPAARPSIATAPLPAVPRLLAPEPRPAPTRPAPVAPTPSVSSGPAAAPPPASNRPEPAPTARAAAAIRPAPVAASGNDILQLSDLSPDERKALPPLKLSMHLWNDDPARRFVILDGERRVEGDRIGEAVLSAITVDGVLLDWNGRRLKLPIR